MTVYRLLCGADNWNQSLLNVPSAIPFSPDLDRATGTITNDILCSFLRKYAPLKVQDCGTRHRECSHQAGLVVSQPSRTAICCEKIALFPDPPNMNLVVCEADCDGMHAKDVDDV